MLKNTWVYWIFGPVNCKNPRFLPLFGKLRIFDFCVTFNFCFFPIFPDFSKIVQDLPFLDLGKTRLEVDFGRRV